MRSTCVSSRTRCASCSNSWRGRAAEAVAAEVADMAAEAAATASRRIWYAM